MTTCVLLECDADVRAMLRLPLEDEGYLVVEAADGQQATMRHNIEDDPTELALILAMRGFGDKFVSR